MTATLFPAGDPAAERRAAFAETMAHLGDIPAAIEALDQALALAPGWAAGWFRKGEYHEALAETDAACAAWDRAVALDPADPLGAELKRDLLRGTPRTAALPPAFVELLFDQYAPRFDSALQDRLGYRGPKVLLRALDRAGMARADRALDLGCGTGLAGAALRARCGWLEGIDLSAAMLAEAEAKGLYDRLAQRDLATLEPGPTRYDLIVAADVFNYVGRLDGVLAWCAGALNPGGLLVFTVERGTGDVRLQHSRRFAHGAPYLRETLRAAGLADTRIVRCVLRHDRGAPVHGYCVSARAASLPHAAANDPSAPAQAV